MKHRVYSKDEYNKVLKLYKGGLKSPNKISKLTGIPVPTIQGWLYRGVKPRSAYSDKEFKEWMKKINTLETNKKKSEALKGKRFSEEHKRKLALSKWGSKNPMWKGDEATEGAIRQRLQRSISVPKGSDRHHIDGNGRNSNPSNILILTRRKHMIEDGRLLRRDKKGRFIS